MRSWLPVGGVEDCTSRSAGWSISDPSPGSCTSDTESALLESVLDNLLGNAVAYAPAGSTVTLRTRRDVIEVRNPAPSLQPDDIANFGQRFWRKGVQGAGHAGLGLALASAASRALGVRLDFRLEDGALVATVSLQRA